MDFKKVVAQGAVVVGAVALAKHKLGSKQSRGRIKTYKVGKDGEAGVAVIIDNTGNREKVITISTVPGTGAESEFKIGETVVYWYDPKRRHEGMPVGSMHKLSD